MAGRFVPMVDFTQDDVDGNAHMSNILLSLPASANVAPNNSALVTFSQAERPHAEWSKSPSDTFSDQDKSLAITVSQYVPSWFTAILEPQETVQLITPRAREALNVQRETA